MATLLHNAGCPLDTDAFFAASQHGYLKILQNLNDNCMPLG